MNLDWILDWDGLSYKAVKDIFWENRRSLGMLLWNYC